MSHAVHVAVIAVCFGSLIGCGNSSSSTEDGATGRDGAVDGLRSGDGRSDSGSGSDGSDGTPTRQTCTSQFGTALPSSGTFGRLDGYLVAIVEPGTMNSCNDDDSHVHLQVEMNSEIYDIAIDATDSATHTDDVHTTTLEIEMPGDLPWSEGFHTGLTVDYPTLGVHSTSIPLDSKAQIVSAIEGDLATANHVSVYTTTYGGDGAHLVHFNGSGQDGLLVTEPLSTPSHLRLFSFSDQSF
jgi:hypothetical protein